MKAPKLYDGMNNILHLMKSVSMYCRYPILIKINFAYGRIVVYYLYNTKDFKIKNC